MRPWEVCNGVRNFRTFNERFGHSRSLNGSRQCIARTPSGVGDGALTGTSGDTCWNSCDLAGRLRHGLTPPIPGCKVPSSELTCFPWVGTHGHVSAHRSPSRRPCPPPTARRTPREHPKRAPVQRPHRTIRPASGFEALARSVTMRAGRARARLRAGLDSRHCCRLRLRDTVRPQRRCGSLPSRRVTDECDARQNGHFVGRLGQAPLRQGSTRLTTSTSCGRSPTVPRRSWHGPCTWLRPRRRLPSPSFLPACGAQLFATLGAGIGG